MLEAGFIRNRGLKVIQGWLLRQSSVLLSGERLCVMASLTPNAIPVGYSLSTFNNHFLLIASLISQIDKLHTVYLAEKRDDIEFNKVQ